MKTMKKTARLNITGLGCNFPRQATLEVLEALRDSDILVNNLYGEEALEFLSMFCGDVRTISYRGDDAAGWAEKIFSWVKPGKTVTFVTRAHPLISGHLARELLRLAKKRKVDVRSYSAISTIDEILSISHEVLSETTLGLQVYSSRLLLEGGLTLQPGIPAVLYLDLPSAGDVEAEARAVLGRLVKLLDELYAADHEILLLSPPYDSRKLERVRRKDLRGRLERMDPRALSALVLFISK